MPIWLPRVVLKILREKATTEFYEKNENLFPCHFVHRQFLLFCFCFFWQGSNCVTILVRSQSQRRWMHLAIGGASTAVAPAPNKVKI